MTSAHDSALDPLFGQPPDKRDLQCRQQLSALMDGCLAADQERFLLRRLQHDAELGQCWERWQIYGDTLRGHAHALLPAGFADRVAAAIAEQDAAAIVSNHQHAIAASGHRRLRWGGTAALAASVALVAFFVGRQSGGGSDVLQPAVATQAAMQMAIDAAPDRIVASAPATAATTIPDGDAASAEVPAPPPTAVATTAVASLAAAQAARTRSQQRRAAGRNGSASRTAPTAEVAMATIAPQAPVPAVAQQSTVPASATMPQPQLPAPASSRPWPKPLLAGMGGARILADYGQQGEPAADFAPFLPQSLPDRNADQPAVGESPQP